MRKKHEFSSGFLFAPVGAPRKGSHEDVIRLRIKGHSARAAGKETGYTPRHVQDITAKFKDQVLPRILQLSDEGFPASTIAVEVSQPEDVVELAIERFKPKGA